MKMWGNIEIFVCYFVKFFNAIMLKSYFWREARERGTKAVVNGTRFFIHFFLFTLCSNDWWVLCFCFLLNYCQNILLFNFFFLLKTVNTVSFCTRGIVTTMQCILILNNFYIHMLYKFVKFYYNLCLWIDQVWKVF